MTAIQWQSYGIILTFTLLCEQSAKTDGVAPFSSFSTVESAYAMTFAAYGGGILPRRIERRPLLEQVKIRSVKSLLS